MISPLPFPLLKCPSAEIRLFRCFISPVGLLPYCGSFVGFRRLNSKACWAYSCCAHARTQTHPQAYTQCTRTPSVEHMSSDQSINASFVWAFHHNSSACLIFHSSTSTMCLCSCWPVKDMTDANHRFMMLRSSVIYSNIFTAQRKIQSSRNAKSFSSFSRCLSVQIGIAALLRSPSFLEFGLQILAFPLSVTQCLGIL